MKLVFNYGPGAVRLGDELSAVGLYFRRINFGMVQTNWGASAINSFRRAVQRVGGTAVASHFDMFVVYRIVGGVGLVWLRSQPALHCRSQSGREKRAFCRGQSAHHRDWRAGRSVNQSDDC